MHMLGRPPNLPHLNSVALQVRPDAASGDAVRAGSPPIYACSIRRLSRPSGRFDRMRAKGSDWTVRVGPKLDIFLYRNMFRSCLAPPPPPTASTPSPNPADGTSSTSSARASVPLVT